MARFVITFGQNHAHFHNGHTFNKDSVGIVEAPSREEAHGLVMHTFNGVVHQCLPEEQFDKDGSIQYFPRGKHPINFKEGSDGH